MLGLRRPPESSVRPLRLRPATRRLRPAAEGLEPKLMLHSTLGGDWTHGIRITYSFVPDGSSVGGTASQLSESMADRGFTESQWKNQFRRAAAVWQAVAKINVVEVPDGGQAIGVAGNQQGDSRFGDIRIAAIPQPGSTLAYANLPPEFNGGTRAGDIVLNSSVAWNINSTYDLQTVAIHEFGHSLGLDHTTISSAVLYEAYNGVKQNLASDDVAGIRAVYGARQHDNLDAYASNNSPYTATNSTSWLSPSGQLQFNSLDITSNFDTDWFYVQAPSTASGSFRVTMQSSRLSSLSPRLEVYNAALDLAGWGYTSSTTYGGTVTLNFSGVTPGTGIFIAALGWNGASSGVNGIGRYGLQLDFSGGPPMPAILPPQTAVAEQPDQGGGTINEETYGASPTSFLAPSFAPETEPLTIPSPLPWLTGTLPASDEDETIAMPTITSQQSSRLFDGLSTSRQFRAMIALHDLALAAIDADDSTWGDDPTHSTVLAWTRRLASPYRAWRAES